ncbi:MAG: hypothetical protein R3B13_32395 [Polyangiaceae bacterium]
MSKPHPATADNSVMTSLAELTRIEAGRLRAEACAQGEQRAAALAAQAEREARERADLQAEQEAEAARAREARMEEARRVGRAQAEVEVARIRAEAHARLQIDNAVRAHELEALRVRRATGRRTREYVLSAALALVTCGAGVGAYQAHQTSAAHADSVSELAGRNAALLQERDEAKRIQLKALDRRHAALVARFGEKALESARATAREAREAVSEAVPTHSQLSNFAAALDALDERGAALAELRRLDARHGDLVAWAAATRRAGATDGVARAAARAKAPGATSEDRRAYSRALDQLRDELSQRHAAASGAIVATTTTDTRSCRAGDPGCGFDGKPLF